jgi:hypothetical protein
MRRHDRRRIQGGAQSPSGVPPGVAAFYGTACRFWILPCCPETLASAESMTPCAVLRRVPLCAQEFAALARPLAQEPSPSTASARPQVTLLGKDHAFLTMRASPRKVQATRRKVMRPSRLATERQLPSKFRGGPNPLCLHVSDPVLTGSPLPESGAVHRG